MEANTTAPQNRPGTARPGAPAAPAPAPAKPKGPIAEAYTFRKQGLPRVRKALTVFGVCLGLSIALVSFGRVILYKTAPGTQQAQQKQLSARERYNQAEAERIEIRDFLPKFEQLRKRGFVGAENRLAMLEAIKAIQQQRKLLSIDYDFSPQQVVAVDAALLASPLELHSTSVHLRMDMLHEMDLFNFLQDLKARGFFAVKDCLVTALDTSGGDEFTPRLTAECTLHWLTIGEPPADPAAPVPPAAVQGTP
ncbi:MAG: hypothetical protein ACJ8GW_08950 [Massilia sp.]